MYGWLGLGCVSAYYGGWCSLGVVFFFDAVYVVYTPLCRRRRTCLSVWVRLWVGGILFTLSTLTLASASMFTTSTNSNAIGFANRVISTTYIISPSARGRRIILNRIGGSMFATVNSGSATAPFGVGLRGYSVSAFGGIRVDFGNINSTSGDGLISMDARPNTTANMNVNVCSGAGALISLGANGSTAILGRNRAILCFATGCISAGSTMAANCNGTRISFGLACGWSVLARQSSLGNGESYITVVRAGSSKARS